MVTCGGDLGAEFREFLEPFVLHLNRRSLDLYDKNKQHFIGDMGTMVVWLSFGGKKGGRSISRFDVDGQASQHFVCVSL